MAAQWPPLKMVVSTNTYNMYLPYYGELFIGLYQVMLVYIDGCHIKGKKILYCWGCFASMI